MTISAYLTGPFRLENSAGIDVTPPSSKNCGLLLLLLTAPSGVRERAWLQDKLWSDRGKEQGAGSLRQAIFQCKKSLGADKDLISANKLRVSLELEHITVRDTNAGEFAEGIDVRDPEFESWLRLERSGRSSNSSWNCQTETLPPAGPKITLTIKRTPAQDILASWLTEVLADQCASLLHQIIGANVTVCDPQSQPDAQFNLELDSVQVADGWIYLRGRLCESEYGTQVWSGYRAIKSFDSIPNDNDDVLQMVFEVTETIRRQLDQRSNQTSDDPPALNAKAITQMFRMTKDGAANADRLLKTAHDMRPNETQLAWQAQVRVIQYFERYRDGGQSLLDESEALAQRALQSAPSNSVVLALAANTLNHLPGREAQSAGLAESAVRANPGNPYAWWTLASVQLSSRKLEQAYQSAWKSRELMNGSALEFLPESIMGGAALALGQEELALQHFERSLAFRPTFKPSLRYALGLNAKSGKLERARNLMQLLQEHESGFRPEQIIEDGEYPTSLFRSIGGVDNRFLRDLV